MSELLSVSRNGVVERLERGHCAVADARGAILWSSGDPHHLTYLRSSAKPFQATALLLSGAVERFGLADAQIAVACGSHHGEPGHVQAALAMLRRAGVPPTALQCGTHDLWQPDGTFVARAGLAPTPLHNNCSGKHSGMLAAAQALGAPLDRYLDHDHPVQAAIARNMARCAGLSQDQLHVGVDGCSAPNFAMPLAHMARAFALLARPQTAPAPLERALERIGGAMRRHPWMVSGTDGFDTALMAHAGTPVISKGGAEGLQCVGLPELGLGLAVKFESGRADRLGAVVIRMLQALAVLPDLLHPALARFAAPAVRNHRGLEVGTAEVLLDTAALADLRVQTVGRAL